MNDTPKIKFGHRGEDIIYNLGDRSLFLEFTFCRGPRVYPERIKIWNWLDTKEEVSTEEKAKVLNDVVAFVENEYREKPIVVINPNDSDRELWEGICRSGSESIKGIEYWSEGDQANFEREMYRQILRAGKGLIVHGTQIKDEKHLDELLRQRGFGN